MIAYCFAWVPWCIVEHQSARQSPQKRHLGYGWLWNGPRVADPPSSGSTITVDESEVTPAAPTVKWDAPPLRSGQEGIAKGDAVSKADAEVAAPNFVLIGLRLAVITAVYAAGAVLTGAKGKTPATRS